MSCISGRILRYPPCPDHAKGSVSSSGPYMTLKLNAQDPNTRPSAFGNRRLGIFDSKHDHELQSIELVMM